MSHLVDMLPSSDDHGAPSPLPSWNDGVAKKRLIDFVRRVTAVGGRDFVPPPDRVAVFDNDGTLWPEQPVYTQLAFAFDRVKALAPHHPEWHDKQPFKGVLAGDLRPLVQSGERGIVELMAATHAGNTTEEFAEIVSTWIASARHPRFDRLYTDMTYRPMVELIGHLRAHDFRVYIVTGGGVEFLRPWVERAYGVAPGHVVGSRARVKYEVHSGGPVLQRLAEIDLFDDKAAKPVGIHQVIGQRPLVAIGNSDGDFEMLEWTTTAPGPRLGVLLHHTDGRREWAYDRDTHIGRLSRGLDEADQRGWLVVDMKDDWRTVFSFEPSGARG